jgi:hypothetical protein
MPGSSGESPKSRSSTPTTAWHSLASQAAERQHRSEAMRGERARCICGFRRATPPPENKAWAHKQHHWVCVTAHVVGGDREGKLFTTPTERSARQELRVAEWV